MKNAAQLKGYSFKYDEAGDYILKNCDFALKYGELCVLSGLSGEGKTTLLSSINGIIPYNIPGVQEGEILIDGQSAREMHMHERARLVGSVLQNADSQIFHSKVCDELAFGCENLNFAPGEIKGKVAEICSLLELSPSAGTKVLSGGQKQRLITGATLAMGQKILMLDEPLANLDTAGSMHLLGILRGLVCKGYAVLLVEHRLDMVIPYADRVLELENGGLVERNRDDLLYGNLKRIEGICQNRTGEETLLSAKCLGYRIKEQEILRSLDLEIFAGERVVILGENGCGKTTLLRLLAGLLRPTEGIIKHSFGVKTASKKWFKKVGYVYQEPSYQLFMPTVAEELRYAADDSWRSRCLRAFSLESLAAKHPQSLSEGQKRRVSIAAVSAGAPELLLLDEPTVGQDFENLENMVTTLNKIHEETGNTMVTITHDYRCAEALADRVIWIRDGRVFRKGDNRLIEDYFKANIEAR